MNISDLEEFLTYAQRWIYFYNVLRPHFGASMNGRTPLAVLQSLGYTGDPAIAAFPRVLLDKLSTDLLMACDPVDGIDLLAHYRYTFAYSLIPHAGGWQAAHREAHAFAAPLRAIPTGVHKGVLPPEQGFIHIDPESLVISAIKMASSQDPVGQGLLVRFYNVEEKAVRGQLRLSIPFAKAMLVNLNEEEISEIPIDEERSIALPVRGKEIVTAKFL